jgi:hypothetical protein
MRTMTLMINHRQSIVRIPRLLALWVWMLAPTLCHSHNGPIHQAITQSAFGSSSGLAGFLNENAVTQSLTAYPPQRSGDRSPVQWLEQGSLREDEQKYPQVGYILPPRCVDHFYTVVPDRTPGQIIGLTDWSEPPIFGFLLGRTSTTNSFKWATDDTVQRPYGIGTNVFKWDNARQYELAALTSTNQSARNTNMAMMLYSLGHVLHLNQDLTVPDHVRNAGHFLTAWFEQYGEDRCAKNPQWFTNQQRGWAFWQVQGFTRLLDFWDRNKFNDNSPAGLNADARGDWGEKLGLAEFCNGNFMGETALYNECYNAGDIHKFPFPSFYTSTSYKDNPTKNGLISNIRPTTLLNGDNVKKIYFDKNYDGIRVANHSAGAFLGIATAFRSPRATQVLSFSPPLQQVTIPSAIPTFCWPITTFWFPKPWNTAPASWIISSVGRWR